jgi:alkanesulfonate monooxygenase SsuD/methylene tetrahydromethanopterin reductase-like flavin-dependent oxidoreductase (luciferase family)
MTGRVAGVPFAPGSVSLRLYPHNELEAGGVIRELCDQAAVGLAGGFDGIMTSEHHGGFAGYLPNPLQMSAFVLEETPSGWVAPCPLLLPLRPVAQVAEEVAWLSARHPGRVGLGVAAGALPLDFEAMAVPLEEAVPRFKAELPRIVDMLQGRDLRELDGDRALQGCRTAPVPVLSAAVSTAAARRAAGCGAGILSEGMSTPDQLRALGDAYRAAGGRQSTVAIRRVWLGRPPGELIGRQRAVYDSYGRGPGGFGDDQTITAEGGSQLAEQIHAVWRASGVDALNLRVHLPGVTPTEARRQITALAEQVLPALRELRAAEDSPPAAGQAQTA